MRILQINNEFPPLGGGTATATLEVARQFRGFPDVESEVITSSGVGQRSIEGDTSCGQLRINRLALKQGCFHHATVVDLLKFGAAALWHLVRRSPSKSFDVVLAWCTVPSGFVAFVLHKLFGLPYVVRVSGPDIPGFEERYRYLYPFLKPLVSRVWRDSSCVVCKCQEEAGRVIKVLPSAPVRIIPNGVDLEKYHPSVDRRSGSSLSLLCVARLVERKGQRLAIAALAALRKGGINATLTLVGAGDSESDYRGYVASLGLSDQVKFLGAVPREEMPPIYQGADVFVLPSSAESMSVACLEALACGLPLVVTSGGGADLFIHEGINGFMVAGGDVGAFAEALTTLAMDPQLRRSFGEKSREIASGFSWRTTAEGLLEVLGDACIG